MRIFKVSSDAPSFEDNTYSLLKKAIREDRVVWQQLPPGPVSPENPNRIFAYAGFIKITKMHPIATRIHSVILRVTVSPPVEGNVDIRFEVLLNRKRTFTVTDHTKIKDLGMTVSEGDLSTAMSETLRSEFSIINAPLLKSPKKKYDYPAETRLTRTKTMYHPATELIIFVEPVKLSRHDYYTMYFVVNNLETGERGEETKISDTITKDEIAGKIKDIIDKWCKGNDYVDESSLSYIPEGANASNFDFVLNQFKGKNEATPEPSQQETPPDSGMSYTGLFAGNKKWYKSAQDYEGYFSGDIPDSAANMWGTPAVDASQIKSLFGKADEAIKLVNQFDSSLLSPVSFIFNFGKTGAYGVYLSALDRAIKTKALQKQLESRGYRIEVNEGGLLTAYPTREEKNPEDIQTDIDNLYGDIESKGSTAFGINMNAILSSSKEDAASMNSPDPNVWEWIAILHLGSTITHEAIHAKGAMDEGPAEEGAMRFMNFALPIVNREYEASLKAQKKEDVFSPLVIGTGTRHAQANNWYRKAQSYMPMPKSIMDMAFGSDLSGRFPVGAQNEAGMAMWGMISRQNANIPIENKLGRQYVFPVNPDINPDKDSTEEQLRKSTKHVKRIDPKISMEEALSEGHDPNRGYQTIENLLDEKRVKPLIVPLKKNASLVKTATLFGWMNNLQISDGSTIPGLGDRVMAWDDRDEDFVEEESWIKKQPRYNPEYDIKGFYYRWIEPRFQPQLFDDMTRDYPGTHPAKRFASTDNEMGRIIAVFSAAKQKILAGDILGTRFIMTDDVLPIVEKAFDSCDCQISVFYHTQTENKEDVYSVWIYSPSISEEDIEKIERHLQKKDVDDGQDVMGLIERVTGIASQKEDVLNSIMRRVEDIGVDCGIDNMSFDRNPQVLDNGTVVLRFKNIGKDAFLKIGSMLADALGARDPYMESDQIAFVYKGYQVSMINGKEESRDELV